MVRAYHIELGGKLNKYILNNILLTKKKKQNLTFYELQKVYLKMEDDTVDVYVCKFM